MKTLSNKKWKFVGVSKDCILFQSKQYDDLFISCVGRCKFVDITTGNVAFLKLVSGTSTVDAEWSFATIRNAKARNIQLPGASILLSEECC